MCGIAGIITLASKEQHQAKLKILNRTLHHRGPDGNGFWQDENQLVLFSHNRLSIIDLSNHAAQPMLSRDRRFAITYNGEIYNYKELRTECINRGSIFTSNSDTEVIIESFRHWGINALSRFRGMWAFALYDKLKNTVMFSRDPFGIKPLYYGFHENDLYFASEPKALYATAKYFKQIDTVSTALFIEHGYLDRGDWTFFKNIKRFPHASYAIIDLNMAQIKVLPQKYWVLPVVNKQIKYHDATNEMRRLLIDSVKLHLRSDVQVGTCLSGGVDSSAIVCIGNKIMGQQFKTFTVHYENFPEINERHWADRIIKHTQSTPMYIEPTYAAFIEDFDKVLYSQDEPFGTTSIFAQHAIFKAIGTSDIKVVLDGQGSDEQLSGYLGFLPQFLQALLEQKNYVKYFKESWLLAKNYSLNIKLTNVVRDIIKKMRSSNNLIASISNNLNYAELADTFEERLSYLTFNPTQYHDVLTQLLCESNIPQLLRYEDRNSMAYSVESRVPFLETNLVEFVSNLPIHFKVRNGYTKAVLRDAMTGIVPEAVRLRINKLGFPTPELTWLKQGFNIDANANYSKAWREIITKRWAVMLDEK